MFKIPIATWGLSLAPSSSIIYHVEASAEQKKGTAVSKLKQIILNTLKTECIIKISHVENALNILVFLRTTRRLGGVP